MAKKRRVADILVDVLVAAGVRHCYGIVGDTLNRVTEAISQSPIQWVHVRHEEVGAFAAGAEAFISGGLTACAGSCGPGSLHFINGIYEAQRNGAPLILIASQLPLTSLGTDFPQEVDFIGIYKNCSVFCQQVDCAEKARRVFTQAAQTALNKRGVAVIILPADIAEERVHDEGLETIWQPQPYIRPNNDEMQLLVEMLSTGKNIGIYAGIGCRGAHDELLKLAELLKAPIAHTARAKDSVEYDNPYNVGMSGIFGTKAAYTMIKECDILLLLGCGFAWAQFYPDNSTLIQIDNDATQLGLRHPIQLGLVGDIKPTLEALIPLLTERRDSHFLDKSLSLHKKVSQKLDKKAMAKKGKPIHPQYLVELIDTYATEDAIFTADTGTPMVWVCRYIQTNGYRRVLASLKHGTMANALPQAIGLQKAYPDHQIIAICGDGGLTMLLGDLFTLVQERLPIKLFVINNGSLNFVELEQKQDGLLNRYTSLKNGDLAQVATAIGIYGVNVKNACDLEKEVKKCLQRKGPTLLNVYTDPNELIMPPAITHDDIKNMTLYGTKAILGGRSKDVVNLIKSNL